MNSMNFKRAKTETKLTKIAAVATKSHSGIHSAIAEELGELAAGGKTWQNSDFDAMVLDFEDRFIQSAMDDSAKSEGGVYFDKEGDDEDFDPMCDPAETYPAHDLIEDAEAVEGEAEAEGQAESNESTESTESTETKEPEAEAPAPAPTPKAPAKAKAKPMNCYFWLNLEQARMVQEVFAELGETCPEIVFSKETGRIALFPMARNTHMLLHSVLQTVNYRLTGE